MTASGTLPVASQPLASQRSHVTPVETSDPKRERLVTWLGLALLLVVQSIALVRQRAPYLEDDGAFFLRYAENIAAGNGYRWNAGEAPVWGASAPLWPLFLAAGIAMGFSHVVATLVWSAALTLTATLFMGLTARRVFGPYGLFALAPLLSINFLYSTWATSGLESPLTFLLVSLALYVVSGGAGGVACGVVAGLCLFHKVDLAPLGLALLFALFVWGRDRFWRALATAAVIAGVAYGLATWYFGTPVPNSFLRKLHSTNGNLPRTWFAQVALYTGAGWLRSGLLVVGALALWRRPAVATVALAAVLVPTAAFTLKPPPEGFLWYPAAISGAVAFLAAGGVAFLLERVPARKRTTLRPAVAAVALVGLTVFLEQKEMPRVRGWHAFLARVTPSMRAAGEWVDQHLAADARVLTWWGHPALASHRFVYDGSGLNRRPEEGNLRTKYRPEVVIELVRGPLADHRVPDGYLEAQTFVPGDGPRAFNGVRVMVRDDVPIDGVVREPLAPRGLSVALARKLLAAEPVDARELDAGQLEELSKRVARRRERPEPPRWLERLEQRIQEARAQLPRARE